MLWFIFALVSAVFTSLSSILSKKELYTKHALEFSTLRSMFTSIFALILLFFLKPDISFGFLAFIYLISLILTAGLLFSSKSLRHLDISTYSPLTNISPVMTLALAFFFLGERISALNFFGIILILIGAYSLEVDPHHKNFLNPFKKMLKSEHYVMLFFSLILLSVVSTFDKLVVINYLHPLVYLCYIWIFNGVNFVIFDFFKFRLKDVKSDLNHNMWPIILVSFLHFVSSFFYILSLSLQFVSLVIPVKKLSTFFDTMIGGSLFHERGIKFKIIACFVMILGAYFITI